MISQYDLIESSHNLDGSNRQLIIKASGSREKCLLWLVSIYGSYEIDSSPELRMEKEAMEEYYQRIPIIDTSNLYPPNSDILMCYTDYVAGISQEEQTLSFYLRPKSV